MSAVPLDPLMPVNERATATLPFFVAAFGLTWVPQLPAALTKLGLLGPARDQFGAWVGLGLFGPFLAAILAARRESGRSGVRAVFAQLRDWHAAPHWYIAALLLPGSLLIVGMSIAAPNGEHAWFYPPANAPHVAALLLVPFLEEIGWRGFALPRLIAKYGALPASTVLGVIWSIWHTPMFVLQGFTLQMFLLALPFFIAGSIVFSWLYLRADGSLPVAILAHAGAHLNNSHAALPADTLPFVVHTIAYCVCAALLVALDGTPWKLARTVVAPTRA